MKTISRISYLFVFAFLLSLIFSVRIANSQMILTNMRMKIVKVERKYNRLQARVHEANKGNVQYILIDGDTKFSHNNKEVSYDEAWAMFKEGMIIRVKGGYNITGKVKAKTIYW